MKADKTLTQAEWKDYRGKYVSVTKGMSGHFAVIYWWNDELGGFWEPYDTGIGRYDHESEARDEAIFIANDEGLPYMLPS